MAAAAFRRQPVRAMCSNSSTLPGPSATLRPKTTRIRGIIRTDGMGLWITDSAVDYQHARSVNFTPIQCQPHAAISSRTPNQQHRHIRLAHDVRGGRADDE